MTNTRKEIDLLIRASVQNKQDLVAIPKTIKSLEEALDKQAAAAKRGESSIDELKSTLLGLEQVSKALGSNAGLVDAFRQMGDAIGKTEERVKRTEAAYEKYRVTLDGVAEVTELQQTKLIKLSKAQESAATALAKQRQMYADIGASMKQAGIDTGNLADAERQMRTAAAELGVVMERNRQTIMSYGDTVSKARTEEKARAAETKANAAAQAEAQAKVVAQQNALYASSQKLNDQLAAAKDAFGRDNALLQQADDAERAAKGFTTLARASADLRPKVLGIKDALSAITDPGKNAQQSLDGLEATVRGVSAAVASIRGPVDGYRDSVAKLKQAQDSITQKAGLIENFRQQSQALRAARTEFTSARTEVAQYAEAVRQGGDSGQRFSQSLATAQTRLQAAATALTAQRNSLRALRDDLNSAGISTAKLADSEQRLVNAARESVAALNGLTTAVGQYGTAAEKASTKGLADGERTTLNFAQRLRGQILSLTASYVGLFGAIQLAKGAIDSLVGVQTIEQRIGVALDSTDAKKIGAEYDYLRNRANYLGIGLRTLADAYGQFSIQAKNANFNAQTTKYTFEQVATGFRVLKLNTDQQTRAFAQVNQMLTKTKPEVDDLKSIAEAGFPVFSVMAAGLREMGVNGIRAGHEVADMGKLMKDGLLAGNTAVYALAKGIETQLSGQVPAAVKTLQAEMGRFETSWFEFQTKIAKGGFGDAVQRALVELQKFFASAEGDAFATGIGKTFEALTNAFIGFAKNIETVKTLSIAFIAVWATARFAEAIGGLIGLQAGINSVGKEITKTQKVFMGFQALIVGWTIGEVLRQKVPFFQWFGEEIADTLQESWANIQGGWMLVTEALPIYFINALKAVVNGMSYPIRLITKQFSDLAKAVGLDGTASSLDGALNQVTLAYDDASKIQSKVSAQIKADVAAIRKNREDLRGMRTRQGVVLSKDQFASPTSAPGNPVSNIEEDSKKGEAAAKKRAASIEAITKSLEELSAKTDKAESTNLAAQLRAVDTQYEQLARRIAKIGGKEGAEFAKQFEEGITNYKGQITDKFNKKLTEEQDRLTKKLEDADAAAGRRSNSSLDARLDAVTTKYAETYRDIEEARKKAEENGRDTTFADQMKARLDAGVKEIQNLERKKFFQDQLTEQEKQVNDLIQSRTAQIQTQKDLEAAGLQDNQTMRANIAGIIDKMQPQIEALATSGAAFATSIQGAFDPAKISEFTAKLQLATVSGKALNKEFEITGKQINEQIAQQGTKALSSVADAIGQAVNKQITWKEALQATGKAALQFFADLIKWYAEAIIKQQILNSVQGGSGGGVGGFFSALFGGVKHSGGVVGGVENRSRPIMAEWFAGAPRMHSGGIAGLRSDEFATILQKNEEVLTANDPRNVLNGGLQPSGGGDGGASTTILVDDRKRVPEAMASAAGGKVTLQHIRANLPTVRQWLKSGN